MNNTDYNDYMLNLYRDCTMQVLTSKLEDYQINHFFSNAASIFNKNIAVDYLTRLNTKNQDLVKKMETYPYMFWKTTEGQAQITVGLDNLHKKHIDEIKEAIDSTNKLTQSMMDPESAKLREINKFINGNLGSYGDKYGEGTLKEFSTDILKIQLGIGTVVTSISVVNTIEKFASEAYKLCKDAGINADFSLFKEYLDYVFESTPIKDKVANINFNKIFEIEPTEKTKLKM